MGHQARGKNETAPAPQPTKEEARARFAALAGGVIKDKTMGHREKFRIPRPRMTDCCKLSWI